MPSKKKLIYAEDLFVALRDDISINGANLARVKQHIEAAPAVEAKPVVRGRWEYWAGGLAQCPVCGYEYTDYQECHNYCGNCGADMRGEEDARP